MWGSRRRRDRMITVKIKCSSCGNEVDAVQYEAAKKIQGFCGNCEKNFTFNLRKGCGVPMLMKKEK